MAPQPKPNQDEQPEAETAQPARFEVLRSAVGNHLRGAVITADQLGADADLDRLVQLGALAPVE